MPPYLLSKFFFQFTFAATASTLVSGALAERCNFVAYLVYCSLITGVIYPVLAHWCWHKHGWLHKLGQNQRQGIVVLMCCDDDYSPGYIDYAGSGVVHLCGAVCAFMGAWLMGPRAGRSALKVPS